MHIGVSTFLNPDAGGIAQYKLMVFDALRERPDDFRQDELSLFATPEARAAAAAYGADFDSWRGTPPESALRALARRIPVTGRWKKRASALLWRMRPADSNAIAHPGKAAAWWRAQGVDLLFSPVYSSLLVESGVPYVLAVHDLQHVLQPDFPENRTWYPAWVEYIMRNAARSATLVIAESETGKEDLLDVYAGYGLTEDRIRIVPYTIPPYMRPDARGEEAARVRGRYALPDRFLFYPAMFFPHKNHERLVEALGLLKRQGVRIPLVLSGSKTELLQARTFQGLLRTAGRLGVSDQVHYLGRVPDEDMTGLYALSTAVVMPSFFGPTNLPVLEAWAMGCPLIASDIRGIREMCGDAALLVDARSVPAIASAIHDLWTDPAHREQLVARGHARVAQFSPERFREAFWSALRTARSRLTPVKH